MGLIDEIKGIASSNTGVAIGSALTGAILGAGVTSLIKRKKSKSRRSRRSHPRHEKKHQHYGRHEVANRKRKKKSHSRRKGGIHYTKKGQPYIILSSGKARFVKKKRR